MARELDDAILMLRTNNLASGTLVLRTAGDKRRVLACDAAMLAHEDNWFVRETLGMLRRTLARLDVSSRSLFAVIDKGSCFAGTLLELALAADRSYMLEAEDGPTIALSAANLGPFTMVNGLTRLAARFNADAETLAGIALRRGSALDAAASVDLGLVTVAPDELDWEDEIRLAVEERASLSPDALTGMEASLRFRPGRTGSSTGPTRSASTARSSSSGRAARRNSIGRGSSDGDRLSGAHSQQRRPHRQQGSAARPRALAAALHRLVARDGAERFPRL